MKTETISRNLFWRAFWILCVTGFLNFIAVKLYLYWTVWWVDMAVHFFGGMWVVFASLFVFSLFSNLSEWSVKKIILSALLCSFCVGLAWELFELYFSITTLADGVRYATDTTSDIIMDMLGGFIGSLQILKITKKYNV